MSKDRKRVLERRDQVCVDDLLDGQSIDHVILELQGMLHKYEKEIITYDKEVRFQTEHYGYDGGVELYVRVMRWETDKEYQKRIDKEAEAKAKAKKIRDAKKEKALKKALETEAEEFALYQKLAAKFG